MTSHRLLRTLTVTVAVAAGYGLARQHSLRWGARQDEVARTLPGDQRLPHADLVATRAVTIAARAEEVWPWLAQLGRGRGGFYTYDGLENLVGLGIHSADAVVPEWQDLAVGDRVHLAAEVGLDVVQADAGQALVLEGSAGAGEAEEGMPFDFVWAFVLRPGPSDGSTRLVVRERYAFHQSWARPMVEVVEWVSLLMTTGMLRGIRDRAEGAARR
ncbi:MAG TPA: SRPBCC family protein [Cellulomonas sp.]